MAGAAGIEPAAKVLETSVIPFHHAPTVWKLYNTDLLLIQEHHSS